MDVNISFGFSEITGLIGAITGISSMLWNLIQWKKDKPKIKVVAGVKNLICGEHTQKNMLALTIINTGKRPVNVTDIGGENAEGDFIIVPRQLPKILQEAEAIVELSSLENYMENFKEKAIIKLYVMDSLREIWTVSPAEVKKINQHLDKLEREKKT